MSIIPYNNFTVRDLSNVLQPYVNSLQEFGYFSGGNLGTIANGLWRSLPAVLNTNNGIATRDASGGLILQAGIYKINLSLFPTTTQIGRSNISFNFGTRYLVNDPSTNIVNAFGGVQPIGMFTYDPSNNPYSPGIISWVANGYDSSNNTISTFIKNPITSELSYNYFNAGYPNGGALYSGIFTTKMSFILDSSASIYFNVSTNSTTGVTMGNSFFTLNLISTPFTVPVKTWRWTARNSANGLPSAAQYWYSSASSSSGQYLAIVGYAGFLYTSSDYGATWIQRSGAGINNGLPTIGANLSCIVSSGSGQYLAIVVYSGPIYTSSNYGVNWITTSAGSKNWAIISSSVDGSRLYAGGYGVKVWRSYNYGGSWGEIGTSPVSTSSITVSESDQYYASIVEDSTTISRSIDYGANWPTTVVSGGAISVAASIDGKYVFMCGRTGATGGGKLFRSIDFGVNWVEINIPIYTWTRITSSVNGQYLAVCAIGGYIYTSSDYGVSWTQQTNGLPTAVSNWQTIESSRDGSRLVAATNNGLVYTGVYS
jgi:photosystem II stability/assembly factor-like uncharacterized protein